MFVSNVDETLAEVLAISRKVNEVNTNKIWQQITTFKYGATLNYT